MTEYKNAFTLDGRLKPEPWVTPAKVQAARALMERHRAGDRIGSATLMEAMTTSDAVFNVAYLANLNFVPNYDEAPRVWRQVAGLRTVSDFRPATLYSLNASWTDGNGPTQVLGVHGEAPVVPEGAAYPYSYISGEVSSGSGVTKKGLKTDWTLEARINDGLGAIEDLPSQMLDVSLDTEESEAMTPLAALVAAGTSSIAGGTTPTGATVPADAPMSRDALIRAIYEVSQRQINGRNIRVTGGWNLLVPIGVGVYAQFILNQTFAEVQDGSFVLNVNGYNPLAGITVVETEYLTGTEWALAPKPGATRRPVWERLQLRGFETPQVFVDNHTGNFVGGGAVSPFQGSFAADVITLKLRQFGGGVIWDNGAAIVTSDGTGT